mgnify:CR=1 FL=1
MAAGILQKPGSKFGPCGEACRHLDCADTRKIAATECPYCSKPIGYGRLFYQTTDPERSDRKHIVGYEHADCAEDAADVR